MSEELNYSNMIFDADLPEPLYLQLADALHERIRSHSGEVCLLPSLRELAAAAGCDRSTAARAYSELERRKVVYRRSAYKLAACPEARKVRNPFPNIGVVIPRSLSAYISSSPEKDCILQYITGIIDCAAARNISTLMLQLPPPEASRIEVDEFLNEIATKVNGVIHLGARQFKHDPPLGQLFRDNRIPQVMISAATKSPCGMGCVMTDVTPAVDLLAENFRKSGISRVGIMYWGNESDSYGENNYVIYEASNRCKVIADTLIRHGFELEEELLIRNCKNYCDIYNKLASLIRRNRLPEAICCQNDTIAIWCIQALERQGIRVPEDVSVLGCDNCALPPWNVRLATIAMPFYELGVAAVELLEELRSSPYAGEGIFKTIPAKLEIKETLRMINPTIKGEEK